MYWLQRIFDWLSLLTKQNDAFICRVQIKCTAIANCNLFFHYRDAKEISFYYFRNTKLCECAFFLFFFLSDLGRSDLVSDFVSAKDKEFSACGELLTLIYNSTKKIIGNDLVFTCKEDNICFNTYMKGRSLREVYLSALLLSGLLKS